MNFTYLGIFYLFFLLLSIYISKKLSFFDLPNKRKLHKKKIVNTSGVTFYLFLFILITNFEISYEIEEITFLGFLVVACGFLDDQKELTPGVKLILILIPVIYLINKGYFLDDLGEYELIGKIYLGKFSFLFTLLACGLLINSYNYVDGIDGLLLGIFIIGICYLCILNQDENFLIFCKILLIPTFINIIFNFIPNYSFKILMGDGGSLFIGFLIGFLLIINYKIYNVHPAFLIWVCWYPVYDFLYVTIFRIKNKINFYKPDNIHFHHIVLKYVKNSHLKASFLIYSLNIIIILLGYYITLHVGKIYSLISFMLFFIFFSLLRYFVRNI
tara:strand:- start:42910 stop:43896 length:987 start_codon:yes stop_codon:yes gene_type:complete